jgi:hypothetical protein
LATDILIKASLAALFCLDMFKKKKKSPSLREGLGWVLNEKDFCIKKNTPAALFFACGGPF